MSRAVLVAVVLVALAAVGGYVGVVKPPREDAAAIQTQIDAKQSELVAAQALLQNAQAAKAAYRDAYAQVVTLGKAVPDDDDLQSLLVQLSAAARRSSVTFVALNRDTAAGGAGAVASPSGETTETSLPPGATVGSSGFPVVPLRLTFKGRYLELADFLRRIDAHVRTGKGLRVDGRLLTINGYTFSTDEQTDGARGVLTAEVAATAYLVAPVEGATAGATPSGPAGAVAAPATPTPAGSAG